MGVYRSADATAPAHQARAISPNDATVIPTTRGIYVGVAGNITVRMGDFAASQDPADDNVLFSNVPVGVLPIQVDKVYLTGTTATNMVALR
jgi:hypothetical protein